MQELRAHDKIPLRSSRYPSVRIQAHAIVPQLPHHALSFVKPDSIKPSRQDAVHRALTKSNCNHMGNCSKDFREKSAMSSDL